MQRVFDEVAKRLMSKDPDEDRFLDLLQELHQVEMFTYPADWKANLKNVAIAYGLEIPECLK